MKYQPYPAYKDSGIEWLGEVPLGWECRRLKDVGTLAAGAGFPHEFQGQEGEELIFYKVRDLANAPDGRTMGNGEHTISRETTLLLRARVIPTNSIIYAKIGAALLLNRRRITAKPCCIDNNMTAYIPKGQNLTTHWAYYWLSILDFGEVTNPGAIPSLSEGYQATLPIALPSDTEQRAIANFLNKKTSKIDTLIAKKKELIEKLKEKRTALISRTVTRGLPPDAAKAADLDPKLKPSGIDWLGDVPERWEVRKITRTCSKILDGTHFSPKSDFSGDYMYITAKNIKETGVDLTNLTYVTTEDHRAIYNRCPVVKGDVLYIKDGATAGIATVNTIEEEFSMLSSVALLRPTPNLLEARYLSYQLNSVTFKKFVLNGLVGGAMTRFTLEIISSFRIVLPDYVEQVAIADFLDRESGKIDKMISKVEAAIDKLQEYRSALITAAVTGKIDVREVAA